MTAGPDTADTLGCSSRTNSLTDAVMSLPDVLRSRSAQLVGSLELGAPLGRGSYGTVYKGALWALHTEGYRNNYLVLDILRSLLGIMPH